MRDLFASEARLIERPKIYSDIKLKAEDIKLKIPKKNSPRERRNRLTLSGTFPQGEGRFTSFLLV
jgi:hypothetical protein